MNPKAWSLLGYGRAEDGTGMYYYHDPISEILMRYGAIVLIAVIVFIALMLRWFHKQAWHVESSSRRQLASAMIALAFSMLLVSALSGSVLTVFPVNIFFWLTCAAVLGFTKQSERVLQPAPTQARHPAMPHYHPQHTYHQPTAP
jgi:hypothetical protein